MKQIKQNSEQDTNIDQTQTKNKFQYSTQITISQNQNTVFYDYKHEYCYNCPMMFLSKKQDCNHSTVIVINNKISQRSFGNLSQSTLNKSENSNLEQDQQAMEKQEHSLNLNQVQNEDQNENSQIYDISVVNESNEEENMNDNSNQNDLLLINQAKRKNVIKNVMYSFKKFMYLILNPEENTQQQQISQAENSGIGKKHYERAGFFKQPKVEDYFSSNDNLQNVVQYAQSEIKNMFNQNQQDKENNLSEVYQKFKRYIENKPFNHQTVCLLIKHQQYSSIFKFFIQNFISQWLQNSKIQDLQSHQKVIQFLLHSYENKSLLDNLQKHKKRKFFQINKKIKKKDKN
ncbi:hypothetical protein TTHERM_00263160 (macronuclear) [Tetrahymena thermophila SB210]|uniref:Uncharacterized protein n=1 Tax=Tetrahymena thermophila (strain SB210) TaxID=312017 RepID=Q22U67_TETTS|nr:hypothetical protein TTHERM_00263160 [Tetrahymena thermophila SB210]EAR88820.2 hypothetical protein TTHERM_00263160 [Tetrahymena thermophila SB210]|eukprot:XP_001009065.2 hypothetical protein TTHERM_00263160 [Tetrahymena thermophila SB210]